MSDVSITYAGIFHVKDDLWRFINTMEDHHGERGPKTKFSKYFFYVFYPAHLWILALIGYITTIA